MKKSKGFRGKTRNLLRKKLRDKGKVRLSKLLHQYQLGNAVVIKIDSSIHKGMPHRRYHGKVGTVVDKRGQSYLISIAQGKKTKKIIVRPEHLEPYNG
jgi:large subunit ribosomal protein L21e